MSAGSMNLFTDEGYRQQGYNKRFRMGGNLTYHQPDMGMKLLNYGFNIDFLSNQYGDFLYLAFADRSVQALSFLPIWDGRTTTSISIRLSTT